MNYGLDEVRFPAPLAVGAAYRVGVDLLDVDAVPGGVQFRVELADGERPALAAECLFRYYA